MTLVVGDTAAPMVLWHIPGQDVVFSLALTDGAGQSVTLPTGAAVMLLVADLALPGDIEPGRITFNVGAVLLDALPDYAPAELWYLSGAMNLRWFAGTARRGTGGPRGLPGAVRVPIGETLVGLRLEGWLPGAPGAPGDLTQAVADTLYGRSEVATTRHALSALPDGPVPDPPDGTYNRSGNPALSGGRMTSPPDGAAYIARASGGPVAGASCEWWLTSSGGDPAAVAVVIGDGDTVAEIGLNALHPIVTRTGWDIQHLTAPGGVPTFDVVAAGTFDPPLPDNHLDASGYRFAVYFRGDLCTLLLPRGLVVAFRDPRIATAAGGATGLWWETVDKAGTGGDITQLGAPTIYRPSSAVEGTAPADGMGAFVAEHTATDGSLPGADLIARRGTDAQVAVGRGPAGLAAVTFGPAEDAKLARAGPDFLATPGRLAAWSGRPETITLDATGEHSVVRLDGAATNVRSHTGGVLAVDLDGALRTGTGNRAGLTALTAGPGAIRYTSGALEVSDGAAWVPAGSAAPYAEQAANLDLTPTGIALVDTDISFALRGASTYIIEGEIAYLSSAAADLGVALSTFAGAAGRVTVRGLTVAAAAISGAINQGSAGLAVVTPIGGVGSATALAAPFTARVSTGSAGVTTLRVRQWAADATAGATTLLAGTWATCRLVGQ